MKQYSVFYEENGYQYPLFQRGDEYFLGGNRLDNLLFYNRFLAEKEAIKIRQKDYKYFRDGKIKVYKCEIKPIIS